jgi:hypothetical protein
VSDWMAGTIRHKAQASARQVTPIDSGFSAWATVPLLDLRDGHDAVVVKDMFEPALGSRVEVRVIQGWIAPERPKAMAGEIECIL